MKYWVIDGSEYKANISVNGTTVILENGLIRRTINADTCETRSYYDLWSNSELVALPSPEFSLSIDGNRVYCNSFDFTMATPTTCIERVPFLRQSTMTATTPYPPCGKAIDLVYHSSALSITATIHYEIYDGVPLIMKYVRITNDGSTELTIDNITADVLHTSEHREKLFVDSDFNSTTDCIGLDMKQYAINYARYNEKTLEVCPLYRMNVKLGSGDSVSSIIAFELMFQAEYYDHKLIEVKEMYRIIAPWCTDSVLFFHLISNSKRKIKRAVDQCGEVGLEMIIQSFGSGVDMESNNKKYLNQIREAYDYAHKKGLKIGAYTLAYVKNYRPVNGDEALNHDFNSIIRCLACDWAVDYIRSILRFIDETGADAVEIDGPYGMMLCKGGRTHLHDDETDSQYKQWKAAVVDWYRELKTRGVYINAPDWHFLNGSNRTGVGYEEIAFSEKRQEQLVTSRIYYYKGTFSKLPSQGWGFLPLNVYHGGGKAARFFPTKKNAFEFDWAMAQLTAAGVWPTIRGKCVYDSNPCKQIMTKWIGVFKKYRTVLNGITIHFLPPRIDTTNPCRTTQIDAIVNEIPYGDVRGFAMFFNQSDVARSEWISIPVFYTGLTDLEFPPAPFENTKNSDVIYPIYDKEAVLTSPIVAKTEKRTYITDIKVADKAIIKPSSAVNTGAKIRFLKEDSIEEICTIDSNGNISVQINLAPMSYCWYVIRPTVS